MLSYVTNLCIIIIASIFVHVCVIVCFRREFGDMEQA